MSASISYRSGPRGVAISLVLVLIAYSTIVLTPQCNMLTQPSWSWTFGMGIATLSARFQLGRVSILSLSSQCSQPSRAWRGPAGGLPRAPGGTERLAVVRSGSPKGRTAVFGQDGAPYRVRHVSAGQGGWTGGRSGAAEWCLMKQQWIVRRCTISTPASTGVKWWVYQYCGWTVINRTWYAMLGIRQTPRILWSVEISRYVPYVYFITLPCILLLSLCFGFTRTPLTLLQLRYILWCFIVYFGI